MNVAIIGAGSFAAGVHAPAFAQMKNVCLVAVCSPNKQKAMDVASRFGIKAVYTDHLEMFAKEDLDAVTICTPNCYHSQIAIDALHRGIHVFCEKPDAVSVAEAERMQEAAQRNNRVLMVMRNNRFTAMATYLKKFIENGGLGEVYAATCGWQRRRGIPGSGWFTSKDLAGGGPLIDLGVHMIDLAMWLMGNPKPTTVSGCTYMKFLNDGIPEKGKYDVEDLATGFIRFANQACLQFECSWASNIKYDEYAYLEFRGTKAGAVWNSKDKVLTLCSCENGQSINFTPDISEEVPAHRANIQHFMDVITKHVEPIITPQQGVDMIKVLESIYKSAETGREVVL